MSCVSAERLPLVSPFVRFVSGNFYDDGTVQRLTREAVRIRAVWTAGLPDCDIKSA